MKKLITILIISIASTAFAQDHGAAHDAALWLPPTWSIIGFVGILLSIAVVPLVKGHWWESNLHKGYVAAIFGAPILLLLMKFAPEKLGHTFIEYLSFMALLGSLFYITGGIYIKGDIRATPRNNLIFLFIGTVIASIAGTTGAAMLLIRALIRTNSERKRVAHTIIFFIFLVCNIGGSLTPIGDPPLFMGYLRGVPFTWTLALWKEWLFASAILLAIYYVLDTYHYKQENIKEKKIDNAHVIPISIMGKLNFLWLAGVIAAIYFLTTENIARWFGETASHLFLREIAMIVFAALSHFTTPHGAREANSFTTGPIVEVAVLFAGIFVTMVPPLLILEIRGATLGVTEPWQFYWFTGGLSSFLDNTPTYLVFFELAKSVSGNAPDLVAGVSAKLLQAVSVGAVFMGANTYIGNGPNFMVKAIAEENSVKMPSFFGYMGWSVGILIPIFILITFVFFR